MSDLKAEVSMESHMDIKKETDDAIVTALEAVGTQAVSIAQSIITSVGAVDTGNLRNSITFETEGTDTVVIGTPVEYAPYIEYGTGIYAEEGGRQTPWAYQDSAGEWHMTRGMHPRPYLRPALQEHVSEYEKIFDEILSKLNQG